MRKLEMEHLSDCSRKKILSGLVTPRPIAWILTENENETSNLAPFSHYNIVSTELGLLSVSISRNDGKPKDTARNIIRTGKAVIMDVSREGLHLMNESSASMDVNVSEIDALKIQTKYIDSIKVLDHAKMALEVTLFEHHIYTDGSKIPSVDHFILNVTRIHLDPKIYDETHEYILGDTYQPIGRLAGSDYSVIEEVLSLKRPK